MIREHADHVYNYLIKPAMDECGIDVFRSDHLNEPGRISEQMFSRILNDDLCIAVLTGNNPNCFYELAIAQAAGRPVIILQQKGETLPFDVADLRCVNYDLSIAAYEKRTYIDAVVQHVHSLETAGWKVSPLIGGQVKLLEADQGAHPRFLAHSADFGRHDAWVDVLRRTESRFDLLGISLVSWRKSRGFRSTLQERTAAGCTVRILLMHPDNPAFSGLINDDLEQGLGLAAIRDQTTWMHEFFVNELAAGNDRVQVRQVRSGSPHAQITLSDDQAFYVPYLYSDGVSDSPLLQCSSDHVLYATLDREFTALWEANSCAQPRISPVARTGCW